jgi:hypothetical protein
MCLPSFRLARPASTTSVSREPPEINGPFGPGLKGAVLLWERRGGSSISRQRARRGDPWGNLARVERFDDLNDNAARLFATPDEGLNR